MMNDQMWDTPAKVFIKYVFPSVLGMVGMSAYILADTFFISMANGADGIATLNLVLPLYGIIFAIGSMIGVGSATRFAIYSSMKDERADAYFSNSILFAILISLLFIVAGLFWPAELLRLMGGDETIIQIGIPYLRIVMMFAPFFMLNYIINAFTRNDGAPNIAMVATLLSSLFNIVFDYILMFPLGLGMAGAALATAISPIVGSGICMIHILSKRSTLKFRWQVPSVKLLISSCQLGIAAFIGEFASGITTFVFNILILEIAGNNGVAAYGIIANISLVVIAVFNGIAQGAQPVFSHYYGIGDRKREQIVLKYAFLLAIVLSVGVIGIANIWPGEVAAIFNSEGNAVLQELAVAGIRIYFIGMLFASVNIVGTGYLGAVGDSLWSSVISVLRGIVVIVILAVVLAKVWKMPGVWSAFPVTELLVMIMTCVVVLKRKSRISV